MHITGNTLEEEGLLYDAMVDRRFTLALLDLVARGRRLTGPFGEVIASPTRDFRPRLSMAAEFLEPTVLRAEQTNTSVVYGDRFVLKLFRRAETGVNPDLELGRFLSEERNFGHIAPLAGALERKRRSGELSTLGVLHGFVPNEGVAWQYTLDTLGRYFEAVLTHRAKVPLPAGLDTQLLPLVEHDLAREWIGLYLEEARLLGQRTGELHIALASDTSTPDLVPEPASDFSRQAVYQAMSSVANRAFPLLRQQLGQLSQEIQEKAQRVLELEGQVRDRLRLPRDRRIEAIHIRCHGDYHLGQVLYTGRDFVIIDFEGEPARPLSERRIKRAPLRDVASMIRSFHYAAYTSLFHHTGGTSQRENPSFLEPWALFWYAWVSSQFLRSYLESAAPAEILPTSTQETEVLLDSLLLEKAMYELRYEINNRPDWVRIPILGILHALESGR